MIPREIPFQLALLFKLKAIRSRADLVAFLEALSKELKFHLRFRKTQISHLFQLPWWHGARIWAAITLIREGG